MLNAKMRNYNMVVDHPYWTGTSIQNPLTLNIAYLQHETFSFTSSDVLWMGELEVGRFTVWAWLKKGLENSLLAFLDL